VPVEVVNGVRLHTQALGRSGSRLVLVHGMLLGALSSWYFTCAPFLARRRRVLMYDLRGHGLSEVPPTGYRLSDQSAELAELLRLVANGERVSVVGHSFGGAIALRFALDFPELVERVVVVEAPLPLSGEGSVDFAHSLTHETAIALLPPPLQRAFDAPGRRAARLQQRTHRLIYETTIGDDLQAEPDIDDAELATIDRDVLLCYARHSGLQASGERLAAVLPRSTLEMFETSHYLPNEAPAALAARIEAFLDA